MFKVCFHPTDGISVDKQIKTLCYRAICYFSHDIFIWPADGSSLLALNLRIDFGQQHLRERVRIIPITTNTFMYYLWFGYSHCNIYFWVQRKYFGCKDWEKSVIKRNHCMWLFMVPIWLHLRFIWFRKTSLSDKNTHTHMHFILGWLYSSS